MRGSVVVDGEESPDTELKSLSPDFRKKVEAFLAELMRRRIYVVVLETRRSPARQEKLVAAGASRTMKSKHLTGDAIDLAPVGIFTLGRVSKVLWDVNEPIWDKIADVACFFDINWGGDWPAKNKFADYVHFEN